MRLFLGFEPTPAESRALYERQQRLQLMDSLPLRWTPPENWHVTLHFLGEVPAHAIPLLLERVGDASRERQALSLTLEGAEWFPDLSRPRMLVLGARPDAALLALHAAVGGALRGEGFQLEQRAYRPHLTLARLQGALKRFDPPHLPLLNPLTLDLQELTLFESIPQKGPPRYAALHRFEVAA